jgi:hypothetical protein
VLLRKKREVVWMLKIGLYDLFYLKAFIITIGLSFLHRIFYMCKCYENFAVAY